MQQKIKDRYENQVNEVKQQVKEKQIAIDGLNSQIESFNKRQMLQTQTKDEKMNEIQDQLENLQDENQVLRVKISRLEFRSQLNFKGSLGQLEIEPSVQEPEPIKEYKNQAVLCFLPDPSAESESETLRSQISEL